VGDRKQDSAIKPRTKTIIGQAMTQTERQARYRTEQAETHAASPQPADRRNRLQRPRDVVAELQKL